MRLGLVVEGEGRALGTCASDNLSTTTHPLQHLGLEVDRQETSVTEVCESSFSFCKLVQVGYSSIHSKFLAHCLIDRKGRAPGRKARPCEEGAPKFA